MDIYLLIKCIYDAELIIFEAVSNAEFPTIHLWIIHKSYTYIV